MAHYHQQDFCIRVRSSYPQYFIGSSNDNKLEVLDIGSQDINGNNRFLFFNYNYTGVDIGPGKNVDVIAKGHEFDSDKLYDIVISTEVLEHDMFWEKTLLNMVRLTKPGKLMIMTCASTGRAEHGTINSEGIEAFSSPLTAQIEEWMNYYKNLTEDDIRNVLDVENIFSQYYFEYNPHACDLYFFGIKK
jgi:hypothetical protein